MDDLFKQHNINVCFDHLFHFPLQGMLDNGEARRQGMTKSMVTAGDNVADIIEVCPSFIGFNRSLIHKIYNLINFIDDDTSQGRL